MGDDRPPPETEVRALQQQLEFILGATRTGLDIIDDRYNLRYVDPAWRTIYGDPGGRRCHEYFMGRAEPCPDCGVTRALATRRPVVSEEQLVREGNRWIQVTSIPFQDPAGEWLVAEVNVDIGERKRLEAELRALNETLEKRVDERTRDLHRALEEVRASELRYRRLMEAATDAIFVVHADSGRIFSCNPRAESLLGLAAGELVGRHYLDVSPPDEVERHRRAAGRAARDGHCALDVTRLLHADGHALWIDLRLSAFQAEGAMFVLAIARDISERTAAEERQRQLEAEMRHAQKLESLGVLAGGIAHDFNNLLTGILGNADLARRSLPADAPAREYLEHATATARRAADLTQQLLAYSGKGQFTVRPVGLSALVREMTQLLEVSISRRHTLHLRLVDDLPAVDADPTQLRQVVMNLLLNASEAIGDRPGTISLTTGTVDCRTVDLATALVGNDAPPGRYAFLEVADTGCGMDETTRQRIFDPFFSTKSLGRGLGLPAVLGIVRGHRGAIQLQSGPDGGTVFRVLFPASNASLPRPMPTPAADHQPAEGGTVLVVDDEPLVRRFVGAVLRRAGFTVLEAGDGEEALAVHADHAAELRAVLLDLTMPRLGGEETLRELRARDAELPIVLSSGYALDGPEERSGVDGASAFLQKPYEVDALLRTIRSVLRGR